MVQGLLFFFCLINDFHGFSLRFLSLLAVHILFLLVLRSQSFRSATQPVMSFLGLVYLVVFLVL